MTIMDIEKTVQCDAGVDEWVIKIEVYPSSRCPCDKILGVSEHRV